MLPQGKIGELYLEGYSHSILIQSWLANCETTPPQIRKSLIKQVMPMGGAKKPFFSA
jgi:hypothetical protein